MVKHPIKTWGGFEALFPTPTPSLERVPLKNRDPPLSKLFSRGKNSNQMSSFIINFNWWYGTQYRTFQAGLFYVIWLSHQRGRPILQVIKWIRTRLHSPHSIQRKLLLTKVRHEKKKFPQLTDLTHNTTSETCPCLTDSYHDENVPLRGSLETRGEHGRTSDKGTLRAQIRWDCTSRISGA